MTKSVILPPQGPLLGDGVIAGGWWHEVEGGKIACDLCPRACVLKEGDRGFCFVRENRGGQIVSTTYGRSTGFCVDPIEKKPLNHFYPGSAVLSFGTAGCNLGCKFCQNWSISKSRQVESLSETAEPEQIAEAAHRLGCRSVAFTYNDPVIWAEYAIDTAKACRALGVKTVAVTAGYITRIARKAFYETIDAANVDLKGFSEEFYWKLTAGHLDPVCDTLRWLARETDVWLEMTNLLIPAANDSPDELKRMCDWLVTELGPDVPVHFTAFHPDFRLTDRDRTPPATLYLAHETARAAGLRYVYTGNLHDPARQSTYCPGCGQAVIQRDGYHLGPYRLNGNRCGHCRTEVAGHFDAGPGDWGARRLPVRIADYGAPVRRPSRPQPPKETNMSAAAAHEPLLTQEEEARVLEAAGRRVAAAVRNAPAERLDRVLGPAATRNVLGVFVSLKRGGQLRSCCGFLGQLVPLAEAIDRAAVRAAKDDPRFPPISPTELAHLDVEVWLLWGMEPVAVRGEDRAKAVIIGRHGLQIGRGAARGLLLPGVAVEHQLDPHAFLRAVCRKAGLPDDAWRDDDATLMTFEGRAIHGQLGQLIDAPGETIPGGGPTLGELQMLAGFCRENILALARGGTAGYYLPQGFDGNVTGAVLSVTTPNGETLHLSQISLQPNLALQSTLFELAKGTVAALQARRIDQAALNRTSIALTVLWDAAMQGTAAAPQLSGISVARRSVLVSEQGRWALVFDPAASPPELLRRASEEARLVSPSTAGVYSMETLTLLPGLTVSNVPRLARGPEVRSAAVAGRFYPAEPDSLRRALDGMLPVERKPQPWAGALVPHAGWVYSGRLAAETLSRIAIPRQVIIIAPKHTPPGSPWAVAPYRAWQIPGGEIEADLALAQRLASGIEGLELDASAHASEHAIEVQLPMISRLAPETRVVGIVLQSGEKRRLDRFAEQLAAVLASGDERPLLVISSDMNHYADDQTTRQTDRMALDCLERLDADALYDTVKQKQISMCGMSAAYVVLKALGRLGGLNEQQTVGYTTSAEASGDTSRVVGYAGMLFR